MRYSRKNFATVEIHPYVHPYVRTHRVNEIEIMYRRSRVNVKIQLNLTQVSTLTFTLGLSYIIHHTSYIASIRSIYARKFYVHTHVKITPRAKGEIRPKCTYEN